MARFECIATVALQHLYFQDTCLSGISLQQQKENRVNSNEHLNAYLSNANIPTNSNQ